MPRQSTVEKIGFFSAIVLIQLNTHMQINDFRLLPHTIHKNQLKMEHKLQHRVKYKTSKKKKIGENLCGLGFCKNFLDLTSKSRPIKIS